jgi:hypothetical protein
MIICTMLSEAWVPEAWPLLKHVLAKAMKRTALRHRLPETAYFRPDGLISGATPEAAGRLGRFRPPRLGKTTLFPELHDWHTRCVNAG